MDMYNLRHKSQNSGMEYGGWLPAMEVRTCTAHTATIQTLSGVVTISQQSDLEGS